MNRADDQLDRLFRAAAQARPGGADSPAFGLETRTMAAWRAAESGERGFWDMRLLVRGLIVAGLITAFSFLPALSSNNTSSPFADFLQLADSTVPSDAAP
jgi:hypothetical protein